ncbi:30S ribosomal protein S17 [Desulfatirhabdium butyrativorans]|uniref:30S ribosomal protein S17 n=1 Tax=Desulfatirhabdium butyrativorans TaxID=340467 RepID=UPI00048418A8|nr:30S ribosomal protein S17 [Desulfatirhabdium butyrativorans]
MKQRGMKRQINGIVVSNKMDKTIVVLVERLIKHQEYHKYIKRQAKYVAHDEKNACGVGDKVLITESRPLSRTKRWRLSQIIEKAI